MQGLVCQPDVSNLKVIDALRDAGLLTVGAGENVIRLLPPLIVTEAQIDEAIALIDAVAGAWSNDDAA